MAATSAKSAAGAFFLSLDQFGDTVLRIGRWVEANNAFRGCPGGDELDDLKVGWTRRAHSVQILQQTIGLKPGRLNLHNLTRRSRKIAGVLNGSHD